MISQFNDKNPMSYFKNALRASMVFFGLFAGCNGPSSQPDDYQYPPVLPLWFIEDDPRCTIFDRKDQDIERDRMIERVLIIPLYTDYRHEGGVDRLAIAHPFVYRPLDEIEDQLVALGQRENLRRLIVWVPGFFPDSIPKMYTFQPIVKGKRVIAQELQPCLRDEQNKIDEAMKTLLEGDILVTKRYYPKRPSLPYTGQPQVTDEPYDAAKVVSSEGFDGRFFDDIYACNPHVLWAFGPGTKIINRLTPQEKKLVADFAADCLRGPPIQDNQNVGETRPAKDGEK